MPILELTERAVDDRSDFDPAHDARGFSVSCSDYDTLVLMCLVVDRLAVEGPHVELHLVPRSADARGLLRGGRRPNPTTPSFFRRK